MLAPLYGDERSSQVLVAEELLLPELAPLEVLELEAEFVSDSPADVDATAASPLVKLFPGIKTDAAAAWTPFTAAAAEEVVVVVVEEYEDELAATAVAELVPSPFAVRAAASLSIVLFVGRSKLLVFVRQVLYAPQWVHFKPTTWNFTVDSL